MRKYEPFIDGEPFAWSGPSVDSVDPSTSAVWSQIARCTETEADFEMRSADRAFREDAWADAATHADILGALADTLAVNWESLVRSKIHDNGKRIAEVRAQFSGLRSWYRHFADEARKLRVEPQDISIPGAHSAAHPQADGVVVAITPYNSPLMILAWKLAPALPAGNAVVVKSSEMASASTLEFVRLAHQSGLPASVLNVVTGFGHEAGEALVRHPLTRKVTFTGSDGGGRKIAEAAADRVVPTTLELGGKSAQVVFADCDLENAVNGVFSGIFLSNGQTCVAGSQLIVVASIHGAFVTRIEERAASLQMGDAMNPSTQVAPLANKPHLAKVTAMITQTKDEDATCLLDGLATAARRDGFYVGPTIFDDVTYDMQLWREGVFGPALAVTAFNTEAEAIELANDSDYGLAGGVWTTDTDKAAWVAKAIHSGTIYINHYRSVDPGGPNGGIKLSGYGRELDPDAVKDFLQINQSGPAQIQCPTLSPDLPRIHMTTQISTSKRNSEDSIGGPHERDIPATRRQFPRP